MYLLKNLLVRRRASLLGVLRSNVSREINWNRGKIVWEFAWRRDES
jgi:hypothetical protein